MMRTQEAIFTGQSLIEHRFKSAFRPWVAIAELIDNSIDWHAKNIAVTVDRPGSTTIVKDDGYGSSTLEPFFRFGGSHARAGMVGRYGVGGKAAGVYLCEIEEIRTVRNGQLSYGRMEWDRIINDDAPIKWEWDTFETAEANGTEIRLIGDRCSLHQVSNLSDTKDYLSKIYMPALLNGIKIEVDGKCLIPPDLPILKKKRDLQHLRTPSGLLYSATIGILAPEDAAANAEWSPGFRVAFVNRVLIHEPVWDGSGEYSGCPVWGYITLEEDETSKWGLDLHKVGFDAVKRAELFDDFTSRIFDMLEDADRDATDNEIRVIQEEQATRLAQGLGGMPAFAIKRGRPVRNRTGLKPGTVAPTGTGTKHRQAKAVDESKPGDVVETGATGNGRAAYLKAVRWGLKYLHLGGKVVGKADIDFPSINIKLNLDNPWVAANKKKSEAMDAAALTVAWAHLTLNDRVRLLRKLGLAELANKVSGTDGSLFAHDEYAESATIFLGTALERIDKNKQEIRKAISALRKSRVES